MIEFYINFFLHIIFQNGGLNYVIDISNLRTVSENGWTKLLADISVDIPNGGHFPIIFGSE